MVKKKKCIKCKKLIRLDGPNRKKHAIENGEICAYFERGTGGRPTKYNSKILKKTWKYIDSCNVEVTKRIQCQSKNSVTYERIVLPNLPTVEGLCLVLEINKSTVYDWANNKNLKEFSDAIEMLKAKQCDMLLRHGLSGDYNPTITSLMLRLNHGMSNRARINNDKYAFSKGMKELSTGGGY